MVRYVEIGSILLTLILLYFLIVFVQSPLAILINSLIAIGILFLLNAIFGLGIPINLFTVLVVAIGGILGLLLILLLRFLKLGFVEV